MGKYTTRTLKLEPIPDEQIPEAIWKHKPDLYGLHGYRVARLVGTDIYQWQYEDLDGEWIDEGEAIQLRPIKKQNRCFICNGNHLPDECPKRGN